MKIGLLLVFLSGITTANSFKLLELPYALPYSLCDPVGTDSIRYVEASTRSLRNMCVCFDGFYGIRCDRISKCSNGKLVHVNCTDPHPDFLDIANLRCIKGQMDLEACECQEGYQGALCDGNHLVDPIAKKAFIQRILRIKEPQNELSDIEVRTVETPSKFLDDETNYWQELESANAKIDILWKLSLLTFLCLLILVVGVLCLSASHRKKSYPTPRNATEMASLCTIPEGPPCYADVCESEREVETASPLAPALVSINVDPSIVHGQTEHEQTSSYRQSGENIRRTSSDSSSSSDFLPIMPSKPYLHV